LQFDFLFARLIFHPDAGPGLGTKGKQNVLADATWVELHWHKE
jgi:hypothetical protein